MAHKTEMLFARVARRTIQTEDIVALDFVPIDRNSFPVFGGGAHIDVHLPGDIVRQYSLCNDPADSSLYRIAVLKEIESRGGSRAVHDNVQVGSTIQISVPRNLFPIVAAGEQHILLAGGIGVTPMIAMCHELQRTGKTFELHYCARSRSRAAFIDDLTAADFSDRVHLHFDDETPDQRLHLPTPMPEAVAGTHFYICGPGGFIEAMRTRLSELGWRDANVHVETFAALSPVVGEKPFTMILSQSGTTVEVGPTETAADALLRMGINVGLSCEQGVCGTCIVNVLSGTPDHRDFVLTSKEKAANNQFTPCCSRALSDTLIIDL